MIFPKCSRSKPFSAAADREPNPGDVALADVLDAGGAVDEVMNLPLQDGFKVLLHFAAGDFDHNAQIHRAHVFHGR